ncbi:conserved hypothetical protein [Candidatus Terasakiella magnetica]|uniref:Protein SirB1 N-terminal domain-containing protein n=1 Tax=Candidatus Terasakiella magnetica TaxID=1867952 RepID=A0A1C3RGN5_9PROT|nr:transglutaminase-like domain-containing protein [Candidatus Terasakiella magnetica]SCA56429.1 conserved hypothetical protein [Candidatus Terasakiella magnetica]
MTLPERLKSALKEQGQGEDETLDLMETAFLVSKILKPSGNIESYRAKIDGLTADLQLRFDELTDQHPPLQAKVKSLQKLLHEDMGFHGDEDAFDDLDHLNMFSMLDERCGTALALSILYIHCAQACGWSVHGLNFPGYSLICLDEGNQRTILDPFNGCVEIDAYTLRQMIKLIAGGDAELLPEFYENLSAKTLTLRHITSIKAHFLRCEQMPQALEILEATLCLEPHSAAFWRETGLLQARIGQLDEAMVSLKESLKYTNDPDTVRHTQHILDDLESKTRE